VLLRMEVEMSEDPGPRMGRESWQKKEASTTCVVASSEA
jgi:hypothetical protein